MSTRLDSALALAERGIEVFPCDHPDLPRCAGSGRNHDPETHAPEDRGKHPCVRFTKKATTDAETICKWWGSLTRNIGIHTGRSGLLVIDEDKPDAFAKYAEEHGFTIPDTFVVKTGKGRHYYFKDTQDGALGNEEGALSEYGINVRSGNGYVIGPGSKHHSGASYEVEHNHPFADVPQWTVDAIRAGASKKGEKAEGGEEKKQPFVLPAVIHAGERDSVIFKYACHLRARGIHRDEAEALVTEIAWPRCEQPPAAGSPFTSMRHWPRSSKLGRTSSPWHRAPEPTTVTRSD
jgi:hypothetical protein